MEPKRIHFVRVAGEVRGPLALEHLRDLAEAGVLTADAEIAASAGGPWAVLGTVPLCMEVFPARRVLNFRAAEFATVSDAATPAMAPDEVIAQANRPPATFRGREVVVTPQVWRGTLDHEPPNEVQQIVQDVGRRVAAHAPPMVLPPLPSPFPRWRWFLTAGVLGSASILSIPLFYERNYDATTVAVLLGWVVLYDGFLVFLMVTDRMHNDGVRTRRLKPDKSE